MEIGMIAALDENNVIGKDGRIPWRIPEDLEHYKQTVDNKVVISGRVTFEETPGTYQGREHIVLSRDEDWSHESERVHHASGVEEAVEIARENTEDNDTVFVIGGENIYREFLEKSDKMVLSHVQGTHEGDTYFPEFSDERWEVVDVEENDDFTVKRYRTE